MLQETARAIEEQDATPAELTPEDLAWWEKARVARTIEEFPSIIETEPHCGYFKQRDGRDGPYVPIAIFKLEGGSFIALRGFEHSCQYVDVSSVWPWCARLGTVIAFEDYCKAFEQGAWTAADGLGANNPPVHDVPNDHEHLKEALEKVTADAQAWLRGKLKEQGKLTTQDEIDTASEFRDQIMALKLRATKLFEKEKEPAYKAYTEILEKWGFRKPAEEAAGALKRAYEAAMRQLDRERQEAARKELESQKPIEEVKQVAPVQAVSSTKTKRLTTSPELVIKDYDKVYAFLKERPEMKEFVLASAKRLHKLGIDVPGAAIENVKKVNG